MATKIFCDDCEREITTETCFVLPPMNGKIVSNCRAALGMIYQGIKGREMNTSGDFCKYCIIDAFRSLDDRPVAGQ